MMLYFRQPFSISAVTCSISMSSKKILKKKCDDGRLLLTSTVVTLGPAKNSALLHFHAFCCSVLPEDLTSNWSHKTSKGNLTRGF